MELAGDGGGSAYEEHDSSGLSEGRFIRTSQCSVSDIHLSSSLPSLLRYYSVWLRSSAIIHRPFHIIRSDDAPHSDYERELEEFRMATEQSRTEI